MVSTLLQVAASVKLLSCFLIIELDVLFAISLISQEMPTERPVIYNRRAPSAGPMYYADDSLEAELNVGRDIKIQTEENDSSSVASYELVLHDFVYFTGAMTINTFLNRVFL